ncbi:histidine kinase [Ulvibacter sp. MAR_2010_11]|uniref:sensor histidine kinase n=1 Tax=Ulvibacter sp. MAR_2010_11 TaxID=1250229 RepID=UPI000C2B9EE8|nr:ATP-binding protein [Ulvibacter sp. MAR_2010_11]PKA82286.1 histidine kinase [Ulvibacter sp. MAR_2010_11]
MDEKEIQSFLIIFSVIALGLALTVIVLFAVFQKRKNKLIQEQQEAERRFQEEIIETQIEIKEDTLRNVSWELHDNIGQLLTLAKIQLQNSKGSPEAIEEAVATIGTSLNELRNLSRLINPNTLSNLTLVEALQQEIERFNRLKYLEASIEYTDTYFFIDNKKEIIIFRMLQEFFTNTVKHSKASKIMVDVAYSNKILYINAQDDGVGFDTSQISTKRGIGLNNIKNRAKLIGADVKITSELGKGTRLSLTYKID